MGWTLEDDIIAHNEQVPHGLNPIGTACLDGPQEGEAGREDVILAGVLILRTVMETLGYQECLVSDLGLREGILIDLAARLKWNNRDT